ncbi:ADP-ribosylation factor-binding protein GGA1 [Cordyceps militaris CM01]|uniref:ADP-ribosylation factor-binding protein GGA1 n=1 Tax=Cordyceps militaris (strain CM01) TaxID=983644 RepID=G3J438_CORMM|nr:ADP-ribosylation factor-binding protein GGA1 [Cordyceps militaris CM01]EGX96609.1 ADP-ribosylation factor-binding protein GGA1 [Cordyceps militaris CM01]
MEAASARAAARDRWGEYGGRTPSHLERYIHSACSPDNYEPNLALNLEISDLINQKKGAAPREAATSIVTYINHRNPNVALLALALLDICVKNCGYPFHLQIGTKEFLNELVRRFPERPPLRATRVQGKILEAIEEWRMTICETSRYKDDLGFIRDMHRLLSYKGYMFPEVRREDAAVLNPSDNLKSAEEMEQEEREAQSAKLQELIRRGTPADLQEANRLMKVMAGYDTRSKTDYRAKAAEEVGKIQAKARLLEERLEAFRPGDTMTDGDVFAELASSLQSAQPKIQKMCEEESDDHEAVAKLFDINDSIHRTVERYKLMKKGDLEGAAKVAAGGPTPSQTATVAGSGSGAAGELSLIDFDADAADANGGGGGASQAGSTQGIENDLLGLDIGGGSGGSFGQGGSIALGFGANQNIPGPALLSSLTDNSTASNNNNNTSHMAASGSSSSQFMSFASASASKSTTPNPTASAVAPPPPPADPFAAFMSQSSTAGKQPAAEDDEWSFSSALPEAASSQQPPREHKSVIADGSVRAEFLANRATASSPAIDMLFSFSNNTAQPVSELHFQLAVTKGYELKLKPQTGRDLAPKQSRGVTQHVAVHAAAGGAHRVSSVKLRWRAAYKVAGEQKAEMGEIAEFSIA